MLKGEVYTNNPHIEGDLKKNIQDVMSSVSPAELL
jgi:hypothetical protein